MVAPVTPGLFFCFVAMVLLIFICIVTHRAGVDRARSSGRSGSEFGRTWLQRAGRCADSSCRCGFSERVAAPTRLADVASASGSLRRLVFHVLVSVAVKGLTRGAMASRAEGQEGYECRVEIYFTAMLFDN